MKEWRCATVVINDDVVRTLAKKLDEISEDGWDIEGMDVIGMDRNKMLIIANREVEGEEE